MRNEKMKNVQSSPKSTCAQFVVLVLMLRALLACARVDEVEGIITITLPCMSITLSISRQSSSQVTPTRGTAQDTGVSEIVTTLGTISGIRDTFILYSYIVYIFYDNERALIAHMDECSHTHHICVV